MMPPANSSPPSAASTGTRSSTGSAALSGRRLGRERSPSTSRCWPATGRSTRGRRPPVPEAPPAGRAPQEIQAPQEIRAPLAGLPQAVVLVTGIQAAGKSTVAQLLAARLPRSVHLRGDIFRKMIVSGRADMTPDSADQARGQV